MTLEQNSEDEARVLWMLGKETRRGRDPAARVPGRPLRAEVKALAVRPPWSRWKATAVTKAKERQGLSPPAPRDFGGKGVTCRQVSPTLSVLASIYKHN